MSRHRRTEAEWAPIDHLLRTRLDLTTATIAAMTGMTHDQSRNRWTLLRQRDPALPDRRALSGGRGQERHAGLDDLIIHRCDLRLDEIADLCGVTPKQARGRASSLRRMGHDLPDRRGNGGRERMRRHGPLINPNALEDARRSHSRWGSPGLTVSEVERRIRTGQRQVDIARELGVSAQRVSQIVKRLKRPT